MDELTSLIVTVLQPGLKKLAEIFVSDAYRALVDKIKTIFGKKSDLSQRISELEANPTSEETITALDQAVSSSRVSENTEISHLASVLRAAIEKLPEGKKMIASVTGSGAVAQGRGNIVAGAGGIAVGGDVHGGIHIGGREGKRK